MAADVVNHLSREDLAQIICKYTGVSTGFIALYRMLKYSVGYDAYFKHHFEVGSMHNAVDLV